jgi:Glycosyl hydrolases family 18
VANVRKSGYWRATLVAAAMVALSACTPPGFINGWAPYWTGAQGRAGFSNPAATPMFSDISPFFFTAAADGTIDLVGSAAQLNTTVHEAHIRGLTVLPSITDGSGRLTMANVILADPNVRAQHIANIVSLTVTYPEIDGVDLDYEEFAFADGHASWVTTQPLWRAFITELAAALHANGKLLSVTIPPTWSTDIGYPVYDQAAIGLVADRIRLMVYDYNVASPGPISPMFWVDQVIAYSSAALPNNKAKLQLGIPSYGRNWGRQADPNETCPDGALNTVSTELENIPAVIAAHPGFPAPSRIVSGEMLFEYDVVATGSSSKPIPAPPYVPPVSAVSTVVTAATGTAAGLQPALRLAPPTTPLSCTVHHSLYFPDAITIQMHAQAARTAGWGGVILWALGYETPAVYEALANTTP